MPLQRTFQVNADGKQAGHELSLVAAGMRKKKFVGVIEVDVYAVGVYVSSVGDLCMLVKDPYVVKSYRAAGILKTLKRLKDDLVAYWRRFGSRQCIHTDLRQNLEPSKIVNFFHSVT
eukprot:gene29325-35401_t